MRLFWPVFIVLCALSACKKEERAPVLQVQAGEELPGGVNATTSVQGENAFGTEIKGLNAEEAGFFVTGNSVFRANWVTAPASVQSLDGLGPVFNAISCGGCHFKDGRAQPPASPGAPLNGLLFRLGTPGGGAHGEPLGDPVYGDQFQDKSILNVRHEGRVSVTYVEEAGQYADGTGYSLRRPVYEFYDLQYGDLAPGWQFSPRIAQQIPGLGLLELVPESDILAFADENDHNHDGISGRANYVWNVEKQQLTVGRFGWKANQPDLLQQTAAAFNGDIGITTSLFPEDHLTGPQKLEYPDIANGGMPELSDETLQKVVSYVRSLAVPARREHTHETVLRGKLLFTELNCAGCHRPRFDTGNEGDIAALRGQQIWPYTDLLLHDMGPGLADQRPDFLATGSEWRTPPLWGIGLIPVVNGHSFLLHDGRARNVEEAILWHGGEAEASREAFKKLDATDRDALIRFLNSL